MIKNPRLFNLKFK